MKASKFIGIFATIFIITLLLILPSTAADSEVIDLGVFASVPVITVDSKNNPHVISYETTNQDLRYSTKVGGSWQSETVDSEGNVGDGHDITIDQDGSPHISYRDITNGGLKYAVKKNNEWETSILDPAPNQSDSSEASSIEIDFKNQPNIAFNFQSTQDGPYIKFAKYNGNSWDIEETGVNGHWPDLALDKEDNPHIVFHDDEDMKVYYFKKTAEGWSEPQVVDKDYTTESDPRIALDSSGNPHVMYRDLSTEGNIIYASFDGSKWISGLIAENAGPGDMQDFALDKDNKPHVVYAHAGNGLILSILSGDQWSHEVVGPARVCSIAVDLLSQNHIAHTDGADDDDNKVSGDEDETDAKEIIKYILVK